jgi:hypothetical protein
MPPRLTLSSRQLTLFFIVLICGPVGCGLLLSYFTRRMPEPTLPALVRLESIWIVPAGKDEARRLVPCISIKNPTVDPWKNLSVGLNEQFYSSEPKGLAAGQTVSLPLEVFVSRNGSVRFPVGNRQIKLVTVFAQIPSGARAVSEHHVQGLSPVSKSEASDSAWVAGEVRSPTSVEAAASETQK